MANKNSFRTKHKKKHKKEKIQEHKKEKKSKKLKKGKSKHTRGIKHSGSSDADSEVSLKNEIKTKLLERTEWGFLDTALSDSHLTVKNKKEKFKKTSPEKPGQNIKELNPYYKNDGCGLPFIETEMNLKDSKKALFHAPISFSSFHKDSFNNIRYNTEEEFSNYNKKLNFLKTHETSNFKWNKNNFRRNWKKKEAELNPEKEVEVPVKTLDDKINPSKLMTTKDLNKLAAQVLKAEIMGNTDLMNTLKAELEAAKKAVNEASGTKEESAKKCEEIVILTDKISKELHESKQSCVPWKKQKIATYDSGERICYFNDDDKYSLKNLFEKEKEGSKDISLPFKLKCKNPVEMDDFCLETAPSKIQKKIEVNKQREINEAIRKHKTLEGCDWCLNNRNAKKHLIVSLGNKCYVCLPEEESLINGHCLIVPLQHEVSTMHLDEDVWSEIKTYQRVLTQMFLEQEQDVIFFENARSFKYFPHCFIQCVPLRKEIGDLAPIYFQKAISESDTEWSNNKKLIDFRQKDLRKSIPKGLPYFAVMFGTSGGFAHIIEDEHLFKRNFAEEIIGGMMDLDFKKWRKRQKENFREQREKTLEFLRIWKKFEFNENSIDFDSSSSD